MDTETYDQIHVPAATVGDAAQLPAGEPGRDRRHARRRRRSTSSCPPSVELTITYTEPGMQGDRSTGGTKPATLETGAEIQVPLFITTGEQGQGRHPRRLLPRPGQPADGPVMSRPQQGPQAGPRRPLRGRAARRRPAGRRCADRVGRGRPAGQPTYTVDARRGRRRAPASGSTSCSATYAAGLDRSTGCPRSTATCCGIGVYELLWRRRRPGRRWRSTRRSSWPGRCRPTTRRRSSTAARPLPSQAHAAVERTEALKPAAVPRRGRRRAEQADRRLTGVLQCRGSVLAATARRASASSTPHAISCSVSTARRLVVDHGQRAQVVLPDRQHLAVVVAALGLDRRGVPGQRARPSRRAPTCSRSRSRTSSRRRLGGAARALPRAAARPPERRRSRPARPAAAR